MSCLPFLLLTSLSLLHLITCSSQLWQFTGKERFVMTASRVTLVRELEMGWVLMNGPREAVEIPCIITFWELNPQKHRTPMNGSLSPFVPLFSSNSLCLPSFFCLPPPCSWTAIPPPFFFSSPSPRFLLRFLFLLSRFSFPLLLPFFSMSPILPSFPSFSFSPLISLLPSSTALVTYLSVTPKRRTLRLSLVSSHQLIDVLFRSTGQSR